MEEGWRTGSLAELVLLKFCMLSFPLEEQQGCTHPQDARPGCWGGEKAREQGDFHLCLSAGTVVPWERSSLGMPPLIPLLQRD